MNFVPAFHILRKLFLLASLEEQIYAYTDGERAHPGLLSALYIVVRLS